MTCHAMIIIILTYFTSCFTLARYICAKINEAIEPEITSLCSACVASAGKAQWKAQQKKTLRPDEKQLYLDQ